MMRILTLVCCLFLLTTSLPSLAISNKQKLKNINQKINTIQGDLSKAKKRRKKLQSELSRIETRAARISKKLPRTQAQLKAQQTRLHKLQNKEKRSFSKLNDQEMVLGKQIRSAYILGRQPYIKLILNQQNPEEISRILMYYRYINSKRLESIDALQTTLQQIHNSQQQIKKQFTVLSELRNKQLQQKKQYSKLKSSRQTLLASIRSSIKTKNQQLNQLQNNKKNLESTIKKLEQKYRMQKLGRVDFKKLKGKLSRPTKGRLVNYFGKQIQRSELHWEGVLFKAPLGTPVYAIAAGKVVFSKWMAGYGLLLIVSHGHGYMTLYGRNQSLYVKAGDVVRKGQLIAKVGETGGFESPALYFAIRHNAKPLNPKYWLRA